MTKRFFQKKKIEDNPLFHNELPDTIILKTDKSKKTLKDLTDLNKKQYELALLKQIKDGLYNPQVMVDTYEYINKDGNLTQKAIDWLDEVGIIHPDYPVSFDNENVHVGVYFDNDDMKKYIEEVKDKHIKYYQDLIMESVKNKDRDDADKVEEYIKNRNEAKKLIDNLDKTFLKDLNEIEPIHDYKIYFSFNDAVKNGNEIKLNNRNIPQEYKDILTIKNKKLTKEGADLFKDMTGKTDKEVDELKNIALDEHIKRIQKEIKNIENFNVQNIENLNVDKINTMTYQKVEQLGKDLEKLISVRIEKNDLAEIVKQIKDEIKTDEALQPIMQKLNEVSEKLKDKNIPIGEIKKDLEEIKNLNKSNLEMLTKDNVYAYISQNYDKLTDKQRENLINSNFPEYIRIKSIKGKKEFNSDKTKKLNDMVIEIFDIAKDIDGGEDFMWVPKLYNIHQNADIELIPISNKEYKYRYIKDKETYEGKFTTRGKLKKEDFIKIFDNIVFPSNEGQGLIRETLTSQANQKIQELTKRIDELEKVIFGVYKDVEKKTETLQNQIMNFNPAQLKHVDVNVHNDEFEPTEIEKNLNDIMKKRREDIEPSEDEDESEEWGEGLIDINKIIKQYEKGRDKIKKYILD